MKTAKFPWQIIGVLHLPPLPGSPEYIGNIDDVIGIAVEDALTLTEGGVDAVLVENFGDRPFQKRVGPATIASMTAVIFKIRQAVDVPLGVNVLRNDPLAALSIAHAAGASFIRVNVLVGAVATDQGIIEGCAREVMNLRRELGGDIHVLADVFVKHGYTLWTDDITYAARDTVERGLADAVIVTGAATGVPPDDADLIQVKEAVDVPVYAGSGATPENISGILGLADGVIVGTCLKRENGRVAPVLVREFVDVVRDGR